MNKPVKYEETLLEIMVDEDSTLSEAIFKDLSNNKIDITSVYDVVDHLEYNLVDLNKVQYYMSVYSGNLPDVKLKRI